MSISLTSVYTALKADDRIIPALQRLNTRVEGEAFLVGGCIRDGLLGRPVIDVDLVVDGDALSCARAFARSVRGAFVVLDAEEEVARVVIRRRLTFDFSPMKGGSLENDLARRDFTINAVACRITGALAGTPVLIDPQGGVDDLQRRRVTAVTKQAFDDDPLRLLRAFRFAAQLGFRIDQTTSEWLQQRAERLSTVSVERIQAELAVLLAQTQTAPWIRRMHTAGILQAAIPELSAVYSSDRPTFDLLDRVEAWLTGIEVAPQLDLTPLTCALVRQSAGGRAWTWLVRLAALLIGDHSPCHRPEAWIDLIATERLRLSKREHQTLQHLVRFPETVCALTDETDDWDAALYTVTHTAGDDTIGVVLLALAIWQVREQDVATITPQLSRLLRFDTRLRAIHAAPRLVTGHDLMDHFDLQPGPQLGILLSRIEKGQTIDQIQSREDAFAAVRTWLTELHK